MVRSCQCDPQRTVMPGRRSLAARFGAEWPGRVPTRAGSLTHASGDVGRPYIDRMPGRSRRGGHDVGIQLGVLGVAEVVDAVIGIDPDDTRSEENTCELH